MKPYMFAPSRVLYTCPFSAAEQLDCQYFIFWRRCNWNKYGTTSYSVHVPNIVARLGHEHGNDSYSSFVLFILLILTMSDLKSSRSFDPGVRKGFPLS